MEHVWREGLAAERESQLWEGWEEGVSAEYTTVLVACDLNQLLT